jgi:hypothetical protein
LKIQRADWSNLNRPPFVANTLCKPVSVEAAMSILNEHQKTSALFMPVICWRYDAPMKIKTIAPAMTSAPLDEIVYRCPACNDERKCVVSRDG